MSRVLVLWCPDWPVVSSRGVPLVSGPRARSAAAGAPGTAVSAGTVAAGAGRAGAGTPGAGISAGRAAVEAAGAGRTGTFPAGVEEVPVAVVAQGRVVACSAEARALGVRRRMRLREAQQRCPGLRVVERDLAAETRDFEPLAARIEQRVVPRLEVLRPGLLAFPARGAARYWGGEEALAEKVLEVVAETGVEGRTGVADTLFAAALAARSGRPTRSVPVDGAAGFLAPYPVGVLGHRELTQLLTRLGLTTLGDFAALPADRVLARFGPRGAAAHRTARGLEARVPHTRLAGTDRSASVEFEPAERAVEPVVFRAKALAEELHGTLRRAGLACSRVEVAVRLTDGRRQARMWRHEGLSALAVAERVRWQLAAWQQTDGVPSPGGEGEDEPLGEPTPAGGSGVEPTGITGLTLTPDGLHAEEGRQGELFDSGAATREEVERAAGRLQAMLGHGAVTRVELGGGRGPGEQVLRIPFGEPDETAAGSGTAGRTGRVAAGRTGSGAGRTGGPGRAGTGPGAARTGPAGGRTEARWVGRLPAPHPAVVYREPLPARLWDAAGVLVEVSGRAVLSAPPARLEVVGRGALEVTGWAGPWPVLEQWWDPSRDRRLARLQIATADGRAWLVQVAAGRWRVEACYG